MKSVLAASEAVERRIKAALGDSEWREVERLMPALAGTLMNRSEVELLLDAGMSAVLTGAASRMGDEDALKELMKGALFVTLLAGYEVGASTKDGVL